MKNWLLALMLFVPMVSLANPSPFGLELGKATVADLIDKYTTELLGVNSYSNGLMYDLTPSELGLNGLQQARVIFDEDGKLVAVLTKLPKHRFDDLYSMMRGKYRVKSQQIPFVGNKKVVMQDGDTEITLEAPHMSFEMEMNYINEGFMRSFREQLKREEEQKRQREAGNL